MPTTPTNIKSNNINKEPIVDSFKSYYNSVFSTQKSPMINQVYDSTYSSQTASSGLNNNTVPNLSARESIVYDFEVTNIPDDIKNEDLRALCESKTQLLEIKNDTNP